MELQYRNNYLQVFVRCHGVHAGGGLEQLSIQGRHLPLQYCSQCFDVFICHLPTYILWPKKKPLLDSVFVGVFSHGMEGYFHPARGKLCLFRKPVEVSPRAQVPYIHWDVLYRNAPRVELALARFMQDGLSTLNSSG